MPLALPTDRDVIAPRSQLARRIDPAEARMVLIPNTLELTTFWVTPALRSDVEHHPELAFETDFGEIPFDEAGNLKQEELFPESQRARRPRS